MGSQLPLSFSVRLVRLAGPSVTASISLHCSAVLCRVSARVCVLCAFLQWPMAKPVAQVPPPRTTSVSCTPAPQAIATVKVHAGFSRTLANGHAPSAVRVTAAATPCASRSAEADQRQNTWQSKQRRNKSTTPARLPWELRHISYQARATGPKGERATAGKGKAKMVGARQTLEEVAWEKRERGPRGRRETTCGRETAKRATCCRKQTAQERESC